MAEHLMRVNIRDAAAEHVGFRLPGAAVDLIAYLISLCPEPSEEFCGCRAHAILNRRDLRNRWNLLQSFAPFKGFALSAPRARADAAGAPGLAYAPLDWVRDGDEHSARVDGRDWRLSGGAGEATLELSVDGALGLDLDAWPPFWRRAREG